MNKSLVTNGIAAILVAVGYGINSEILLSVGLFALSGALTNWIAIHMLFEKVPGFYGSGVIPSRFEEFKAAIHSMMMQQFFNPENIERFMANQSQADHVIELKPVIEQVDLTPAFNALVTTVEQSSFGSMLSMFGGSEAIAPLKQPFEAKMKASLVEIADSEDFQSLIKKQLAAPDLVSGLSARIDAIVEQRLNELTPQMVKEIVQQMIKQHLGWLVVWGGVFGGLIGLIAAFI